MENTLSNSASRIQDLRYSAENFGPESQPLALENLRNYASSLIACGCPPPVENSAALVVTTPVVDGQGVGIQRLSNLDLNGKLVKKGVTVSYHGLRFLVTKVNRGHCYGKLVTVKGINPFSDPSQRFRCESLQVVA